MAPHRVRRRLALGLGALGVVLGGLTAPVSAPAVSAHTGFEASWPADGESVTGPVDTVKVSFTADATPVGDEFLALDATGTVRAPESVTTVEGADFLLSFRPPLAPGLVGVRWEVQAGDAHPIRGSFSFTVNDPAPLPSPPSAAPSTTVVAVTTVAPPTDELDAPAAGSAATASTTAAPSRPHLESIGEGASGVQRRSSAPPIAASPAEPSSMEQFLVADETRPGELLERAGRIVSFFGVVLALGGLAFLAWTFRGGRAEIQFLVSAVRVLGAVAALGAALELGGVMSAGRAFAPTWTSSPGLAIGLRLAGGLMICASDRFATIPDPVTTRPLSASVLDVPLMASSSDMDRFRWGWKNSGTALIGAAMTVVSFWFDGHTVSKGIRPVHAVVNSIHVVAGGVWVGGVTAMALVVWRRRRQRRPTGGAELAIRFSSVASVALGAVVSAGAVMGIFVLDSVQELIGTEWGRVLMYKTAAVSIAAALGAYNHFRLLPKLRSSPRDRTLEAELRASVTVEAVVLVLVVCLTSWLVAATT